MRIDFVLLGIINSSLYLCVITIISTLTLFYSTSCAADVEEICNPNNNNNNDSESNNNSDNNNNNNNNNTSNSNKGQNKGQKGVEVGIGIGGGGRFNTTCSWRGYDWRIGEEWWRGCMCRAMRGY